TPCCLIHDSQADKKEFILDLKKTYEGFLESPDSKTPAEEKRREALAALKQDLAPLQRYDDTMRSVPPQAGVPLRGPLHRSVELRDNAPELPPREQERLPVYALWEANRERLHRLAGTLEEIQGHAILSTHPLKQLKSRLAAEEQPQETASELLRSLDGLLDDLEARLAQLDLEPEERDSPEKVAALVCYAASM